MTCGNKGLYYMVHGWEDHDACDVSGEGVTERVPAFRIRGGTWAGFGAGQVVGTESQNREGARASGRGRKGSNMRSGRWT